MLHPIVKQRSNSRSIQTSVRGDADSRPENSRGSGMSWLEQGLPEALYSPGPYSGADMAHLLDQLHGVNEGRAVVGLNGWDVNLQPFSPTSTNPLAALSATDAAVDMGPICTAPAASAADSHEDSGSDDDEVEDGIEPTNGLSSQLTSLSQRTARAIQRLVRLDRVPLMVSSPEVSEALENTNTLIRIITKVAASGHDGDALDPTTTNCGLAFSALACHQQILALFRAICDAIHGCLLSNKEQEQRQQRSDVGPSLVAQFVMVLQLLMHLINRIDRSLFQSTSSIWHGTELSTGGGNVAPGTPGPGKCDSTGLIQSSAAAGGSPSSQGGLLVLVYDIVDTIPKEHEKLRQVIRSLQKEMEHSELH